MSKPTKIRLLLLVLLLATVAGIKAWPQFEYLEVDGWQRRYLATLPEDLTEPVPLLLVFHGGGGTASGMSRQGFSRLASERGFLVVYPDGVDRRWTDPRWTAEKAAERPDDLHFTEVLLDHLSERYPVDPARVYVCGVSNGAILSHALAARLSERITAICPIIGGFPEVLLDDFQPTRHVSVLIINGTEDTLVPYEGGMVGWSKVVRGPLLGTEKAVDLWVKHNQCRLEEERSLPDTADDGCTASATVYRNSEDGSTVSLVKVVGGGHTVPGGSQYLPQRLIGKVCRDFDAVEVVGEFCAAQARQVPQR